LEEIRPDIFVDYAHTPDSLEKTLSALRQVGYEKVVCVFGCGGNRDRGKRKLMGRVACRLAEFTFITSDNPRHEEPMSICRAIEKGFVSSNYALIPERKTAIFEGLRLQKKLPQSCLLVAGKGHEAYQIIKDEKIPFKDSLIIKELLKKC
jgi:UDP-N-acetylmuramoyl-L-alanyl-D-glutamate--2,6-diaminopimelate ligase